MSWSQSALILLLHVLTAGVAYTLGWTMRGRNRYRRTPPANWPQVYRDSAAAFRRTCHGRTN